jgi:pyruvate formate lyase activating enzyme
MLYHRLSEDDSERTVVCDLCHHRCIIASGKRGICQARRNDGGTLVSLVYGHCIALTPDPIEKKPLFHYLPGTRSMSVATVGCNFTCDFCQNHHISQYLRDQSGDIPGDCVEPDDIVRAAEKAGCRSLSFTYTEPTIFFEYAFEAARLAQERGIGSCFVSNGFMTPEAVDTIAPYLDAINVDLKSFDPEVYRSVMGGRLDGVLETIQRLHEQNIWIEITTLLIEGMNDSENEVREIARFIADLDPSIPWHVSRFHPQYRMDRAAPTAGKSVLRAVEIGREAGLRHIYCGNMRDARWESTWCASCGGMLIERAGFRIVANHLSPTGACPACGASCSGRWGR